MDDWEKFNEASLPEKEDFYSPLNVEDISELLADIFKNFQKMCLKIYKVDPANSLYAPGLLWQETLKRPFCNLRIDHQVRRLTNSRHSLPIW